MDALKPLYFFNIKPKNDNESNVPESDFSTPAFVDTHRGPADAAEHSRDGSHNTHERPAALGCVLPPDAPQKKPQGPAVRDTNVTGPRNHLKGSGQLGRTKEQALLSGGKQHLLVQPRYLQLYHPQGKIYKKLSTISFS